MRFNPILNSDSYKYSMYNQYPPGCTNVFLYAEARGGVWPETVAFGLQHYIKEYMSIPFTRQDIEEAEEVILAHMGANVFNREGMEYVLNTYGGYWPVIIRSVPEGTIVPTKNALLTVENIDPKCWWTPSFLETGLLRAFWYGTSVATNSYLSKQIILEALERSGTPETIHSRLHDFGARGVSSRESAAIGGAAHLVNFTGTDNHNALMLLREFYGEKMAGFSVPAMEHSTVTSWTREHEIDAYSNMIDQYGGDKKIVSIVSDSYNIYAACEMFGTTLKEKILNSGTQLVVRPDSGDPATIVLSCLKSLDAHFGHQTVKGFKVLNNVSVLQGDGIDHHSIRRILETALSAGYSADNLYFGQGGALLQKIDRDIQKWALKCSAAKVNGTWTTVYKDPITDPGKSSKRGRVTLFKNQDRYYSGAEDWHQDELKVFYDHGELGEAANTPFKEIRKRANF